MCSGKCSRFISGALYPLVLLSVICNVVLFFPDMKVKYAKEGHITEEVKYMGGVIGGGVLVLISALYIHLTGQQGCCGNRFGMLLSIVFASVGLAGALYSFFVAMAGLGYGPLCLVDEAWERPFKNSSTTYLGNAEEWEKCEEPKNVVQFNIGLFITLMVVSCVQGLLCAVQVINGLFGCLCGTGDDKQIE